MPETRVTPKTRSTKPRMDENLGYYDEAFFKKRQAWRADYRYISDWIGENIEGKSIGDIGCGNGYMITYLHTLGKKVWGVDAAKNYELFVDKVVRKYVNRADLTQVHKLPISDVVICFEVAERIDKKYADTLLGSIVSTGADTILFTASKPGQAGIHHINLQPKDYWLDKFDRHGYFLDVVLTEKFKTDLSNNIKNVVWYLQDIMILRKRDNQTMTEAYDEAGVFIEELKQKIEDFTLRYAKLKHHDAMIDQQLNTILISKRWKASSKLIRIIKR